MIRSFRGCATVALLCLALTAGACGKKKIDTPAPANTPPPAPAPEPTKPAPPPAPAPAPAPAPRPPTEDEIFAKWTLDELNKQGLLADAFFALDSIELNQESRGVIQKNGEFLKRRPSTKVMVEGHADSRGTLTGGYHGCTAEPRVGQHFLDGLVPRDQPAFVAVGDLDSSYRLLGPELGI